MHLVPSKASSQEWSYHRICTTLMTGRCCGCYSDIPECGISIQFCMIASSIKTGNCAFTACLSKGQTSPPLAPEARLSEYPFWSSTRVWNAVHMASTTDVTPMRVVQTVFLAVYVEKHSLPSDLQSGFIHQLPASMADRSHMFSADSGLPSNFTPRCLLPCILQVLSAAASVSAPN